MWSDSALKYAIANQRDRRNITDADIARCVMVVDQRKAVGRPAKTPSGDGISGTSAAHTAHIAGTSTTKVEKVRRVVDHAASPPP